MNMDTQPIVQALGGLDGLRLAIVFGSCATGRQRPDSDLDIALDIVPAP